MVSDARRQLGRVGCTDSKKCIPISIVALLLIILLFSIVIIEENGIILHPSLEIYGNITNRVQSITKTLTIEDGMSLEDTTGGDGQRENTALGALLCISGSWRSFFNSPAIIRSFRRLIGDLPGGSDVVVFITDHPSSGTKAVWSGQIHANVNQFLENVEMLQPRRLVWWNEQASREACMVENCWICDKGSFLQMQHVDKCFQLADEIGKNYTHVIRIRPDFYLPYHLDHTQLATASEGSLFTSPTSRNIANDMFWVVPWTTYIDWWHNGMRRFIMNCDKEAAVGPWWVGPDYGAIFNFGNNWVKFAPRNGLPAEYPIHTFHMWKKDSSDAYKFLTGASVAACEEGSCKQYNINQSCCETPVLRTWGVNSTPFPEHVGELIYHEDNAPLERTESQQLWRIGISLDDELVRLISERPFWKKLGVKILQMRTPSNASIDMNDTAFSGDLRILDIQVQQLAG